MDTLRLASELRRVDMMLAGVAELRQMCINQEIQKRAAPKRQVFSESMQVLGPEQQQRWVFRPHSLSDSVDSDDESTVAEEKHPSPLAVWTAMPSAVHRATRTRKRHEVVKSLRAIEAFKAQCAAATATPATPATTTFKHGGRGETPPSKRRRRGGTQSGGRQNIESSASSVQNDVTPNTRLARHVFESESFSALRATVPPALAEAITSGDDHQIKAILTRPTEFVERPYLSRTVRRKIVNRTDPESVARACRGLVSGDIIHVPMNERETKLIQKLVEQATRPFREARLRRDDFGALGDQARDAAVNCMVCAAGQLPGRTRNDCVRYYLDVYQGSAAIFAEEDAIRGVFRVEDTRRSSHHSSQSHVDIGVSRGGSRGQHSPCRLSIQFDPHEELKSHADTIHANIATKKAMSVGQNLSFNLFQRQQCRSSATQRGCKSARHQATHNLLGSHLRFCDTIFEATTGGAITDVKFGQHPHTRDKILYGVTDTKDLYCAAYDATTGRRTTLLGHTDAVEEVHVSKWGYLTGSHDTNIHLYDFDDVRPKWRFTELQDKVLSMALHGEKPLFAASAWQAPALWLCNFLNRARFCLTLPHAKPVVSAGGMTFGNDKYPHFLAVGVQRSLPLDTKRTAVGGSFTVYQIASARAHIASLYPCERPVQCVCTAPSCSPLNNWIAYSCSNEKIFLFDLSRGCEARPPVEVRGDTLVRKRSKRTTGHNIHDCSFSPDGMMLQTCGEDNTVVVHDVRRLDAPLLVLEHDYIGGSHGVACQWSADSRFLVSGADDCTVRIWDVVGGRHEHFNATTARPLGFARPRRKRGRYYGRAGMYGAGPSGLGPAATRARELASIRHNRYGAICALSLSQRSDMIVTGTIAGKVILRGLGSSRGGVARFGHSS